MNYSPLTQLDKEEMLQAVGVSTINELFKDLPKSILRENVSLPPGISELEAIAHLKELSSTGYHCFSFAGAGAYRHFIPSAVDELASRSEFYTAYTPYQPEVSQGTLTAIFEFQSMICSLTGLDVTNASMYDGASAAAEALLMALRKFKKKRAALSRMIHPAYIEVIQTYCWANDITIEWIDEKKALTDKDCLQKLLKSDIGAEIGAVLVQSPNFSGQIERVIDFSPQKQLKDEKKQPFALIQIITEPYCMGLLKTGAEVQSDIVCGEAASFGNPIGFGGPALGFLSADKKYMRLMPGRFAGKTIDSDGNPCFALTLQTREQHIRREKATSNICSNEGLCALRAAIALSLIGKKLHQVARMNRDLAYLLREGLKKAGFRLITEGSFFNEWIMQVDRSEEFLQLASLQQVEAGVALTRFNNMPLAQILASKSDLILFCTTEINTPNQIKTLIELAQIHMNPSIDGVKQ